MAYSLRILATADKEFNSILDYLEGFGKTAAGHFADEYENQINLLASGVVDYGLSRFPELARRGYHSCLVDAYVMLYYYEEDELVIAHIFHSRQDYARLV